MNDKRDDGFRIFFFLSRESFLKPLPDKASRSLHCWILDLTGKVRVADKASQTLAQTGRITVVVHDNGSLHKSHLSQKQWQRWEEQGLYIFFLPPYCSEMNPIETEWHQLKEHEIAGQMFDNEYDLALAVMEGMKARSEAGNYHLERFIFNCA